MLGWYEAHFHRDYNTSDESWAVSWERRRSQYVQSYSFPNILLDGWEALKAYFFDKRQSKGAHFEKIFRRAAARRNYLHFFRRASRGAAWPLHFKFASYAYALVLEVLCSCTRGGGTGTEAVIPSPSTWFSSPTTPSTCKYVPSIIIATIVVIPYILT